MMHLCIMAVIHGVLCSFMRRSVRCGLQRRLRSTELMVLTAPREGQHARRALSGHTREGRTAGARGRAWPVPGFPRRTRQGRGNLLGLAGWNNSVALSRGWSPCLVPGMTKAEEYCCWAVRARQRRAGSGLVSLHVKGRLLAGPLLPLRTGWL